MHAGSVLSRGKSSVFKTNTIDIPSSSPFPSLANEDPKNVNNVSLDRQGVSSIRKIRGNKYV